MCVRVCACRVVVGVVVVVVVGWGYAHENDLFWQGYVVFYYRCIHCLEISNVRTIHDFHILGVVRNSLFRDSAESQMSMNQSSCRSI